jgi:hypothetical protein
LLIWLICILLVSVIHLKWTPLEPR